MEVRMRAIGHHTAVNVFYCEFACWDNDWKYRNEII